MLDRQTGSLARVTLWMFGRSNLTASLQAEEAVTGHTPTRRSVPAGLGTVRLTKPSGRGALVCSAFLAVFRGFGTTCSSAGSNGATPNLEGVMAKEKELKDLFLDTLKDIYFAEKKILSALPKMAKAAQSPKLKAAFEKHLAETDGQVDRLDQVFASIDETPKGKTGDAIMGIIEEGKEKKGKGSPQASASRKNRGKQLAPRASFRFTLGPTRSRRAAILAPLNRGNWDSFRHATFFPLLWFADAQRLNRVWADKPLRLEAEALLCSLDHGLCCADLGLANGAGCLDINDDAELHINEIVV